MDKESEAGDEEKAGVADAVRLFQQSARRANPDFDLDRERVHVQRICRLVDGAPLGIELAAAWLKALSCEQIARELEQSLDFLSTSLRNIPDRHRSMRVVLEQTWHYLSAEEQRVFRRLSIFAGGFRADAAQAVAEASLRMLASLVEKSVLHLAQDGRYRIHSLLRQLAAEKLAGDPSELAAAQARHSTAYMAFLRDRQPSIAGPDQKHVLVEVEEEMDNIRVAWSHATRHQRLDDLYGALPALFRFLWTRGRYEDGEHLTAQALDRLDSSHLRTYSGRRRSHDGAACPVCRGPRRASEGACHAGPGSGPGQPCRQPARTSALPLRDRRDRRLSGRHGLSAGQPERCALNLSSIGRCRGHSRNIDCVGLFVYLSGGRLWAGPATGRGESETFPPDRRPVQYCRYPRPNRIIDWKLGQLDESETCYQECLAIARDIGQQFVVAKGIGGLGLVAWARGQLDFAIQLMFERLECMQELGNETESLHQRKSALRHSCPRRPLRRSQASPGSVFEYAGHLFHSPDSCGRGAYADAMYYLPQATAAALATNNRYDLASYLNGWAMLLMSDCALKRDGPLPGEAIPLPRGERIHAALEIVMLLHTYNDCRADTRKRAGDLLGQWQDEVQSSQSRAENRRHEERSIEELAEEILTIHLA